MSTPTPQTASPRNAPPAGATPRSRKPRLRTSLAAHGEPLIWIAGGALVLALAMIVALVGVIVVQGFSTFWPAPVWQMQLGDGTVAMGEITRSERIPASAAPSESAATNKPSAWRRQLRTGNFDVTGTHFQWFDDAQIRSVTAPEWAVVLERTEWGRFYGFPEALLVDGRPAAQGAAETWRAFVARRAQIGGDEHAALVLKTAGGQTKEAPLSTIVHAYPANRMTLGQKLGVYTARWREFLTADPREANSEGGVFPAIFGTVTMTLLMTVGVVPFGVLAALYLREYAYNGWIVTAVRVAVNNLAGVPSIVFGVFGLGFFCYLVGGTVDQLLFADRLPNPTYGTGGILWASLTLALLTLPVVIVASEEALAAVPNSMREGSYACGASKWQTIWRIVLPRALPGIMTGTILAMARGAGEVAPLMLVGAVKLAPHLPMDGSFPYLHPERSFMHLGFHIFDLAFQNQNSEAARPMVFTTTLLLIAIVATLNILAVWLRTRLRRRFQYGQF